MLLETFTMTIQAAIAMLVLTAAIVAATVVDLVIVTNASMARLMCVL